MDFTQGADLSVGEERHGSGFTGAVAFLAMGLEDGEDVTIEGGRWSVGLGGVGRTGGQKNENAHLEGEHFTSPCF